MRARRLAPLAGLLLAGCAPSPDADQIRLCRIAVVALTERDATVAITSQSPIAAGPDATGVAILAAVTPVGGPAHPFRTDCRYATGRIGLDALVSVRTSTGPLPDWSLALLKRFWLATPEADQADPQPVDVWRFAPALPTVLAHGLQAALAALPGTAVYGLLAAAYSLVYGLVGRINLAFGSLAAVGGVAALTSVAFVAHPTLGSVLAVTLAGALWAGALHGLAVARWVFRPLGHATGQQGLVATVGLALLLDEYLRLAQGPSPLWMVPLRAAPIGLAAAPSYTVTVTPLAGLVTAGFAAVAAAILALMARSQYGRNWRAMADDPAASALMGVDPARMLAVTVALASCLAALAGAVTVLIYGSFGTAFGTVVGLKALLAAVLGGIGSVPGAFLGGLVIAAAESAWSALFPIEYRDLALFVGLSVTLVLRPGGILGWSDLAPRRV